MAAGSTYTPIATTTLGSAQSSVTFNSFSGYTDLLLVFVGTSNHTDNGSRGYLQFNGDTASNYSNTYIQWNGSSASSARDSSATVIAFGRVGNSGLSQANISIQNYANSTTNKTILSRQDSLAASNSRATVGLWRSTSAITSITVSCDGSYVAGSTFTLYGIAAA